MWFDKRNPHAVYMDIRRETCACSRDRGRARTIVVDPDILGDFTAIPFPDESFRVVVFDPPHLETKTQCNITKHYGTLTGDWRSMLRAGFAECFRVLRPGGVLIFKWSEYQFPVREILDLTPVAPLFGHRSGKQSTTHWLTFMKD